MTSPRFEWRHQYDELTDEVESEASEIVNNEPPLTQQHFAKDADLNVIVKRFGVHDGAIPPIVMDPTFYGDFTDVPDFRQSIENIRNASERFNALPADLRARFANDPVELWAFVNDPANEEESIKLGLLSRDPQTPRGDTPAGTVPATDTTTSGVT